ncbi:unnamed protein product [Oppiella nova]|uniref:ZP domain-containing protein n=1 Tax=Oppiella nova TaxID=334625 RepID=A0A7R9MG78_9ACAR|nr:unnamed protein product [Oppiella nova]CAG2176789.1 unnamed protein product [Oppiella nova]
MSGQRVGRVIHGNTYILRAQLTPYDSITSLRIKNCFAFTDGEDDQVQLIDAYGCPLTDDLISQFTYNTSQTAEAILYEMFKFPDTNKLNIQCDAILCRGGCQEPVCDSPGFKGRDLALDGYSQLSASTSLFVFEPTDDSLTLENLSECTEWRFPWLITLCIVLAVLLLLMLLLNMFMCSSLSCRCIKTEIVEQEPDETIEEYDPYRADWTAPNSRYGSQKSLNKPYDSTLKSNKSHKSYLSGDGYDNEEYVPDRQFSTLQTSGRRSPGPPLSTYSTTRSLKSNKSGKQKPIKTIEIDYSMDNKNPYNFSRR